MKQIGKFATEYIQNSSLGCCGGFHPAVHLKKELGSVLLAPGFDLGLSLGPCPCPSCNERYMCVAADVHEGSSGVQGRIPNFMGDGTEFDPGAPVASVPLPFFCSPPFPTLSACL